MAEVGASAAGASGGAAEVEAPADEAEGQLRVGEAGVRARADEFGTAHDYEVRSSRRMYDGRVVAVRRDIVAMPGGGESQRDVVEHPGAVGIVALDDADRVLLVRQYRHPVGRHLWELPAGLLDQSGEPPREAAGRELFEEASLRACDWLVLVDALTSPGMTDEAIRIYLARDLSAVPEEDRHDGEDEEAELQTAWVALDDALRRVFAGEIENGMAIMGLLAADRARARGYAGLRPVQAAWPARDRRHPLPGRPDARRQP